MRLALVISVALGLWAAPVAQASEFNYEKLVRTIRRHSITRIEELLPRLPASFRSDYTLMFASRSLQEADPARPRVILFGEDARLTCAFNGELAQAGSDTLECIQFRDRERRFDFRQIQFPTPANGLRQVVFSRSGTTADGRTSCSLCHGSDPRPNWFDYSFWKGAYGEDNDYGLPDASSSLNTEQIARYEAFVKARELHPRYRWLLQEKYRLAPYIPGTVVSSGAYELDPRYRPNLRFAALANRLNAQRDNRLLGERLLAWEQLAFAVSALRCPLDQDQTDVLTAAGMDLKRDLDLGGLYTEVGVPAHDWSMHAPGDDDPSSSDLDRYNFFPGLGYLLFDVAMVTVNDLAHSGNRTLKSELRAMEHSIYEDPSNSDIGPFSRVLNAIVPDSYAATDYGICPELTRVFTATYLGTAFGSRGH